MTLWTGQRVGAEPAPRGAFLRPCSICARPIFSRRPGLLALRAPSVCRTCRHIRLYRIARRAGEILRDLAGAAAWAVAIWALYYVITYMEGYR